MTPREVLLKAAALVGRVDRHALVCALTLDEAREIIASLQAQLDALDPIAEAERRMVEAWNHERTLSAMSYCVRGDRRESIALKRASLGKAGCAWIECLDAWLALVEARDAKGRCDK